MTFRCGASIDGPKIYAHVVAWRKSCRVLVKNQGDVCRFHGKVCPVCGVKMYDRPGWAHSQEHRNVGDTD